MAQQNSVKTKYIAPTWGKFDQQTFPNQPPLMSPWLNHGESSMIYAPTGLGKSWLGLSIAAIVAGGGSFAGWSNDTPRTVMYVDGEMPGKTIQTRLRLLKPALAIKDQAAADANLRVMARQMHPATSGPFLDLSDTESRNDFRKRLRANKVDLVVLDNLSTLALGIEDENSSAAFSPVVSFLLDLKADGIGCLLIHHANKTGASYRGSTKIAVTFETIIRLSEASNSDPLTTEFNVSFEKFRERRDESTRDRTMRLATDDEGNLQWIAEVSEESQMARLVTLAKSAEFVSQDELATALGVSKGRISQIKSKAVCAGLVTHAQFNHWMQEAKELRDGGYHPDLPNNDF